MCARIVHCSPWGEPRASLSDLVSCRWCVGSGDWCESWSPSDLSSSRGGLRVEVAPGRVGTCILESSLPGYAWVPGGLQPRRMSRGAQPLAEAGLSLLFLCSLLHHLQMDCLISRRGKDTPVFPHALQHSHNSFVNMVLLGIRNIKPGPGRTWAKPFDRGWWC